MSPSSATAEDGISMNSIVKSHTVNEYVTSKGFNMPKRTNTVTKCILKYYEIKKKKKKLYYQESKEKKNIKSSQTVDQ